MPEKQSDEFLLEEYKLLSKEMDSQRSARDYSTVLALTVGLSILGYAIQSDSDSVLLYILPLLVFVVLYVGYVTRSLYALKADTYIRYFIEARRPEFNWNTRKSGFSIGAIYQINRALVSSVFAAILAGNLYFIYVKGGWCYLIPCMLVVLVLTGIAAGSFFRHTPECFVRKWQSVESEGHNQDSSA
jgi:hypothetical protein